MESSQEAHDLHLIPTPRSAGGTAGAACTATWSGGRDYAVAVDGPLVLDTIEPFRTVVTSILDAGACNVALDLSRVPDIDTAGVGTVVMLARRLRERGGAVRFTALSRSCTDVLDQLQLFKAQRRTDQALRRV